MTELIQLTENTRKFDRPNKNTTIMKRQQNCYHTTKEIIEIVRKPSLLISLMYSDVLKKINELSYSRILHKINV
jgi:hypothetical protein